MTVYNLPDHRRRQPAELLMDALDMEVYWPSIGSMVPAGLEERAHRPAPGLPAFEKFWRSIPDCRHRYRRPYRSRPNWA